MTRLEEVGKLLSGLERAEKAQVLKWVVQEHDLGYPHASA
jgi:hypothetical protein